jgi:hypothetical protein
MLNSTKQCGSGKCKQINPQPLTNFYKSKRNRDGLEFRCKICKLEYCKERRNISEVKAIQDARQKERRISENGKKYQSEYGKKWYSIPENKIKKNQKSKEWYEKPENKTRSAKQAKNRMSVEVNVVHRTKYHKIWVTLPENKEKLKIYEKTYNNTPWGRAKRNAKTAKRKAFKLQATPKWITKERAEEICNIYLKAQISTLETGISHNVDHIIPLQGENVSGLHVPWNLQILTASENSKKKNSFDFTYENNSWRQSKHKLTSETISCHPLINANS